MYEPEKIFLITSTYIRKKKFSELKTTAESKDLYQVQETWKFFFLTYIQLCVLKPRYF